MKPEVEPPLTEFQRQIIDRIKAGEDPYGNLLATSNGQRGNIRRSLAHLVRHGVIALEREGRWVILPEKVPVRNTPE